MADRTFMFREWLKDLTPEKIELLVRLEKLSRMMTHVFTLVGEVDLKLFEGLRITSRDIKEDYEKTEHSVLPN
jgi:hypothetical protein